MKTAVFIFCLIGMAYTRPFSSESHSKSISDSLPDSSSSSSSEERFSTAPTVNVATVQSIITEDFARGDSLRRRRAVRTSSESSHQDTNSIESISDSASSSEEVSVAPTHGGTTPLQTRDNSLRRRRSYDQVAHGSSSSHHSQESVTTESTSRQSQPSESSEEDSHEQSTKKNLLQEILGTTTPDPDTSEESSEGKDNSRIRALST